MSDSYFSSIASQLRQRPARATISYRTPSHTAFRDYLRRHLEHPPGKEGSFLSQPVFESLFEYEQHSATVGDIDLLHPTLVDLLDTPPGDHADRRFPKDRKPYRHQFAAWKALKEEPARSVIVSTGTASGKTECFLIPILDDLVREWEEKRRSALVGVRALFLYPLNALINSQEERLSAWTAGLNGGVRFCLYNGATRNQGQAAEERARPERVLYRKTLRESPPPILVTNATMLEYMLVRAVDRPIIEQSQGKLRWIVLDEAHTYLGSNAAEVSLLLRRVMHAFGADSKDVRFVATSATIGDSDDKTANAKLQKYLADLAGVDAQQVTVVGGRRVTPKLQVPENDLPLPTPSEVSRAGDLRRTTRTSGGIAGSSAVAEEARRNPAYAGADFQNAGDKNGSGSYAATTGCVLRNAAEKERRTSTPASAARQFLFKNNTRRLGLLQFEM